MPGGVGGGVGDGSAYPINDGCANLRLPPNKLVRITILTNFTIEH